MLSSASASSRSGSLLYAPSGLDAYLHNYKDYLDTERFGAKSRTATLKRSMMPVIVLITTLRLMSRCAFGRTRADAARSCGVAIFDMLTCLSCVAKKSTDMLRDFPALTSQSYALSGNKLPSADL